MLVTRDKQGDVVNTGDIVNDFRGDPWAFVRATRPATQGKSGKVLVQDAEGYREFYETVFDLTVEGE